MTIDGRFGFGVVGGVGPLATVVFMGKVVHLTEAKRDQDHIRMIVEQNPQIPDRTEHLIHGGTDPTIALFATCKKLEADDGTCSNETVAPPPFWGQGIHGFFR